VILLIVIFLAILATYFFHNKEKGYNETFVPILGACAIFFTAFFYYWSLHSQYHVHEQIKRKNTRSCNDLLNKYSIVDNEAYKIFNYWQELLEYQNYSHLSTHNLVNRIMIVPYKSEYSEIWFTCCNLYDEKTISIGNYYANNFPNIEKSELSKLLKLYII
jgi:hypothetical protein